MIFVAARDLLVTAGGSSSGLVDEPGPPALKHGVYPLTTRKSQNRCLYPGFTDETTEMSQDSQVTVLSWWPALRDTATEPHSVLRSTCTLGPPTAKPTLGLVESQALPFTSCEFTLLPYLGPSFPISQVRIRVPASQVHSGRSW